LEEVTDNIHTYEVKAMLAKDRLKGSQLVEKLKEIQNKIDSLTKMQTKIKNYTNSRQEELFISGKFPC
jgi:hypothetical protein